MSQHTPGPWEACGEEVFGADRYRIRDGAGMLVALTRCYAEPPEAAAANAHLIAAAPDLLAMCEESLRLLENRIDWGEILEEEKRHWDALRGVINKAKGE